MSSILYLMRHARAAPRGVLAGSIDYPLTRQGTNQALAWQDFFKALPVQAVWRSPLTRARQTATLCLGETGPQMIVVEALREISLGEWEGMDKTAIRRDRPEEWEARGRSLAATAPPGGESFQELEARVRPAFEDILRKAASIQASLVVAHQAVNRCLLARLLGLELDRMLDIPQDEACLNILRLDGLSCTVEAVNLTPDAAVVFKNKLLK